ncbi:helix-turn-helix domain protein [Burkholderia multivorans]|uniref:Helix-turn-helix domain protein n=1 Tax=Burkholderia multivorans TaxID=87883 RepID=A0ABD7L6W6_9BURK|nr:helix-turn-helix domain-containing protein [Burkholderia multivorans]SAJ96599.1 helix-turn-helix domain protein [Burkholderia multivorans]
MSRHFWRCNEKALVTRMYEAGAPLREIAAATGVSADAIRRAVGRWELHRPHGHIGIETRENLLWPRVKFALEQSGGMTIYELCDALETFKSTVIKTIAKHRDELHIARWIPTTRRPKAVWALGKRMDAPKPIAVRRKKAANPFGRIAEELSRGSRVDADAEVEVEFC